jgi:dipeptide/tripeptide permease
MRRVALAATLTVCGVGIFGTMWLGFESELFELVNPFAVLAVFAPYLVLGLLAWGCRRRTISLAVLFAVSVLLSAYGLLFFSMTGTGRNRPTPIRGGPESSPSSPSRNGSFSA